MNEPQTRAPTEQGTLDLSKPLPPLQQGNASVADRMLAIRRADSGSKAAPTTGDGLEALFTWSTAEVADINRMAEAARHTKSTNKVDEAKAPFDHAGIVARALVDSIPVINASGVDQHALFESLTRLRAQIVTCTATLARAKEIYANGDELVLHRALDSIVDKTQILQKGQLLTSRAGTPGNADESREHAITVNLDAATVAIKELAAAPPDHVRRPLTAAITSIHEARILVEATPTARSAKKFSDVAQRLHRDAGIAFKHIAGTDGAGDLTTAASELESAVEKHS